MKIKRMLFLVLLVGLLASMGASSILAEDGDIPMWVQRARLTYTGRSSGGPDQMIAFIHIRDAELNMVDGATVTAVWTLPDETTLGPVTATTNIQGIAEFGIFEGAGDYTIRVIGVTKEGWIYDPDLNRETEAIYWLPPYPYPRP